MFESVGSIAEKVRVFVSYDREHDGDLHDRLVEQASQPTSVFEISEASRLRPPTDPWDIELRRAIREADQVIFLCGEHSDDSTRMATELRIAQEEERPYFLLWGRRERMCTRPDTARPADAMYRWTPEILKSQLFSMLRAVRSKDSLDEESRKAASQA